MTIDEDELTMDEDLSIYQGKPFTGVARAYHSNGVMKRESPFYEGFEQGRCREWYDSGQLKREWNANRGVVEGKAYEWHPHGQPKLIATYFQGIELSMDEWNLAGLNVVHREIDRLSELGKYLESLQP